MRWSKKGLLLAAAASLSLPAVAGAATQLELGDTVVLSENGGANKTKIVRLPSGRLISVYGDYLDPNDYTVYDVKADAERPARDLFVRTCESKTTDCGEPANWSAAVNISNTAGQSSMSVDADGNLDGSDARTRYYGDSDKPNIFNAGSRVVITWVDKYCPDGDPATPAADPAVQRSVSYLVRNRREVPFSCTYAISSANGGTSWSTPVQLSSGERDAKQDVNRGLGTGEWGITWQEDPLGLQLGEAEGPGDGASGANTSPGTEIWYTDAASGWSDPDGTDGYGFWNPPVRMTDNATQNAAGDFDVVRDNTGVVVDAANIEGGKAGASRANLTVQFNSSLEAVPQAIVAYEETKGSEGLDEGKFIRYHTFDWDAPDTGAPGCIISNPAENARRVRFVPQKTPGPSSGIRLGIFWKEGHFTHGGPSDIMLRKGLVGAGNGFSSAEMTPAVDSACETSDYLTAIALSSEPGLNMSSRTETAQDTSDAGVASSTLADTTNQKVEENALAHRGLLRGDDLYVGYNYTPVLAELLYTNTQTYNFYLRHYDGATGTWSAPENLSHITDTGVIVREPRLVGTPGNGPGCLDPASPVDPEDCRDPDVFYMAWGSQTNVSEWSLEIPVDLDVYLSRGEEEGAYFTDILPFAGEPPHVEGFESQIRPTPAGNFAYMVWNESDSATGKTSALFRVASTFDQSASPSAPAGSSGDDDKNIFGCSYNPAAPFDPTLLGLLGLGLATVGLRRLHRQGN